MIVTVIKNGGTIIVMVIVNTILIIEMRSYWKRKIKLTNGAGGSSNIEKGTRTRKVTRSTRQIEVVSKKNSQVIKMVSFIIAFPRDFFL